MSKAITSAIDFIKEELAWIPPSVVAALLLALAALLALAVHNWVARLVRRFLYPRAPYLAWVLSRARSLTRFGLVIIAVSLVLPLAPLSPQATATIGKLLLVAMIALLGWTALVAVKVSADVYLLRFRIDTEDNLLARKHVTQIHILRRAAQTLVIVLTAGFALMTFDAVRQYGVSLFASAGVAGLVVGLAARPLLSNLIAGVQIATTQPIRIDDAVLVEGEMGHIEEITSTYVVIKIWDWRRLIVPLSYFMEKPFQNWTREGAALIGSVFLLVDYAVPVARLRAKLDEIVRSSARWDGEVLSLQVTDAKDHAIELRALVSARNSSLLWDLRCEVRENLIAFLQEEYPQALPRQRAEVALHGAADAAEAARDVRSPSIAQ